MAVTRVGCGKCPMFMLAMSCHFASLEDTLYHEFRLAHFDDEGNCSVLLFLMTAQHEEMILYFTCFDSRNHCPSVVKALWQY